MRIDIPSFDYIPQRISRVGELAYNLWWSWNSEARKLYRTLDRTLWRTSRQNPVKMLREVRPERLATLSEDESFCALYDRVVAEYDEYMTSTQTWAGGLEKKEPIAYFCAEFAVHTSVPIYSGGLGLLAGDTCKEASDLGLPFVAIGAFYPEGYFLQKVAADGTQETLYEQTNIDNTPLLPVLRDDGSRFLVQIPLDGKYIDVAVWKLQVGRVPIYLMDTDIPENDPWDRDVVARLYGGDNLVRLRQEIILGMGGARVLDALGYDPAVIHLNEGHAAFAALELIHRAKQNGSSFEEAVEAAREKIVFTTHTPVKAGHDEFPFHMMEEHFRHFWDEMAVSREDFLALGTPPGGQSFSMTVLALRTARKVNGVSKKHGEVSRAMWNFAYPDCTEEEVPISSITNGVHVPTWLTAEFVEVINEYVGSDWKARHDDHEFWRRILEAPDESLWAAHRISKSRLFTFMQERARARWMDEVGSPGQIVALGTLVNPEALTIGFARRFATYKRATLILRDIERLKRIILNPWRPLQIVFAGKAHPADEPGKFLLKQIYDVCSSPQFGGRVAFIENYDKQVGHRLVSGVDVWLNNPEPPKEASGTSGQKSSLNGVLNFSVSDGWWCEGYNGKNGWVIEGMNDAETAESMYSILENEIVPAFYDRDSNGVPRRWIALMKEAIASTSAAFSARRMMKEYVEKMYYAD